MMKQVTISRSVFESISTIFYASRISGICSIGVVRRANGFSLVRSKRIIIYSYFFVGILIFSSVYGLVQNSKIKEVHNIRLRTATGVVCTLSENVFLLFSCLLGTILAPFLQRHFLRYLECLHEVDVLLGPKNLNQKAKCSRVAFVYLSIMFGIVVIDITLWAKIVTRSSPLVPYLLNALPFYLTYICQMIVELHFWMLVHLVKVRLVCLNEDLMELLQEIETYEDFLKHHEYMNKKLIQVVSHSDGVKNHRDRWETVGAEKIFGKVKTLTRIHNLLVETGTAVNCFFGINVLVLLVGSLMHLLVTPYVLYLQITATKNHIFVASQLMWLICHVSKLLFIIEPCQACKAQVQRTVATLCKLLRFEVCKEAKTELQSLLVQLDRYRIQFTACNLVIIDRSLLTAVTGTVTTYLVILFQFK